VRIYTGGGDQGETGLFGGGRVAKDDARVEAYGTVDELNAAIGLARSAGLPPELDDIAGRVQAELFVLGADLATPEASRARDDDVVRLGPEVVATLEADIDRCEEKLPALTTFILPGGAPSGAALHLARTISRRAERRLVSLARTEEISDQTLPYLNRLSDLLFVLARLANASANAPESPWTP
jgi:cob(I)alamin adenosyltransferase